LIGVEFSRDANPPEVPRIETLPPSLIRQPLFVDVPATNPATSDVTPKVNGVGTDAEGLKEAVALAATPGWLLHVSADSVQLPVIARSS
jgi:hypothetical protein